MRDKRRGPRHRGEQGWYRKGGGRADSAAFNRLWPSRLTRANGEEGDSWAGGGKAGREEDADPSWCKKKIIYLHLLEQKFQERSKEKDEMRRFSRPV